jgi:hypothetical protein
LPFLVVGLPPTHWFSNCFYFLKKKKNNVEFF